MSHLAQQLRQLNGLQEAGRLEIVRRSFLFPLIFINQFDDPEREEAIAAFRDFRNAATQHCLSNMCFAAIALEDPNIALPRFIKDHPIEWEKALTYLAYGDGDIERRIPDHLHEQAKAKAMQIIGGTLAMSLNQILPT